LKGNSAHLNQSAKDALKKGDNFSISQSILKNSK
jgi:hypothetical protein